MPNLSQSERRAINKADAAEYVRSFYRTSWDWRSQFKHNLWAKLENNYHSIYPQAIKEKKEPWQSCLFIPETFKVVEVIFSALVKTLLGRRRPIGYEPRENGDLLQAELNTDLLSFEIDYSRFVAVFGEVLKECLIYGTGFMKMYFEVVEDTRRIREPKRAGFKDSLDAFKQNRLVLPGQVLGYDEQMKKVRVRKGVVCERVHIRDIFLEPNSRSLERVLHREKVTLGALYAMAKEGKVEKDAVDQMRDAVESATFESDLTVSVPSETDISKKVYEGSAPVNGQVGNTYPEPIRPKFDKEHTVFEMWAPIPRRFIELELDPEADESNEIVPGKILVGSGRWFLGSEYNPLQAMRPPFFKMGYVDVNQTYDKGPAEIIMDLQEDLNETSNQRIDNVALIMNKMIALIESALVDPNELVSRPGGAIRFSVNKNEADIRKLMMPIEFPDLTLSAYRETQERERQIQEASAANRVTLGTAGQVNDQNKTLGGMQLLKQAAADRFTTYAFFIGQKFLREAAQGFQELIYQNRDDADLERILGNRPIEILPGQIVPRWQAYRRAPPHELCLDYDLVPVDVFTEEDKLGEAQRLQVAGQFTAGILPSWNPSPLLRKIYSKLGLKEDDIDELLRSAQGPIPTPLMAGKGQPSLPSTAAKGPAVGSGVPPSMMPPGAGGPGI